MLDSTVKRQIDSARNILVGKVPDPKAQIDQITTAMIYKFMDDMDKEAEELGGNARFFADTLADYSWTKLMDVKLSGDERITLYKEGIEKLKTAKNIPELFRNIFKNYYLPFYDQRTLSLFLKEINEFSYDNSENLGNAFEYLLSILGSQGDAGQFRTPRHIIDFVVAVVNPQKNETILDPACGTAGFLISAYKHIVKTNSSNYNPEQEAEALIVQGETATEAIITETVKYAGDNLTPDDRTKLTHHIAGYDIDSNMVKLALVNLYLHGFPNPQINEYDTLSSDKRWDENFDVILANPPFMTPKGGIVPHKRFSIQANRAEVLFVDYIAEHLSIKGRAGIIVPEGIVFQSANAYKNLRKNLIENWGLYAVVSLPSGVFQPYAGVKTSILLLDKDVSKRTDEILFLKVEHDGFDLGAQRRKSEKNDLPDCLHILNQWKKDQTVIASEEKQSIAFAVKKEKIAEKGEYNLTGDRYRETVDYSNAKWDMVEIGKVCEILNGYAFKSENYIDDGVRVMRITNVQKGEIVDDNPKFYPIDSDENIEKYILKENDLLLSLTGNVGRVGLIKKEFLPAALNQRVACLREIDERINIKYLFSVLNTDKFEDDTVKSASGIAQKNLSTEWLKTYQIPLPPLVVQEQIVAEIEQYQKVIDGAKQVVENWKPSFRIDQSWEMVELGEVCELVQRGKSPKYGESDIQVIKSGQARGYFDFDFKNKYFVEKDFPLDHRKLRSKDLLINSTGVGTAGRITLFDLNGDFLVDGHITIARLIFDKVKAEFALFALDKIYGFKGLESMARGNGGQIELGLEVIKSLKIPLPPLPVQEQIVSEIEAEQRAIDECKKLIEKMQKKVEAKIGEIWGEE